MDTSEQTNNLLTPVKITIYEKDRRKLKVFAAKRKLTLAQAVENVIEGAELWQSAQQVTSNRLRETFKPDAAVSAEGGEDLGRE